MTRIVICYETTLVKCTSLSRYNFKEHSMLTHYGPIKLLSEVHMREIDVPS